ncbi:hypothetical protein ACIKT0_11275 [Hansschlegelia beijingensis]|uniref:hypothetical protein n=1 Tax=Hansschlegelia beijingensis TaxID=1133344 RepID=UPI00387F2589
MSTSNIDLKRLRDLVERAQIVRDRRRRLQKRFDNAHRAASVVRREFELFSANRGLRPAWDNTPVAMTERTAGDVERANRERDEAYADLREAQREGGSTEAVASACAEYAHERLGDRCPLLVREFLGVER